MIAKGQITVTNIDDGKTPFLHQAYKMKDGRFLKHYPVYEVSPVSGYKEGDLWHRTDGSQPGYFVANKSNTTLNLNDWTFYANELAYSDIDKFYPKFEGTYSDYNKVASDDQTKYTWKIIKADDGIGIKSVKEYYAVSASNVTPPSLASDWSETPKPTNTTNKYLWNYEVYTYSNGDGRETTKRVIGTHGATGVPGNGIVSVTNYYLATTLGTGVTGETTATQQWKPEVQKTDPVKKYLWNYEEILYTSGSKIPTAPVIIGTHGEKGDNSIVGVLTNESITLPANKDGLVSSTSFTGATGVFDVYDGITKKTGSGVTYSLVSQSNITVTINATTGAYSVTAMPTGTAVLNGFAVLRAVYSEVTIEKQLNVSKSVTGATGDSSYTWIRYSPNANGSSMTEKPGTNSLYVGVAITSENSSPKDSTKYTWALIKGADGKGVKSAAITYQASTSGTVIPTGSWGPTVPTVPKGQYLWTRVITTYTDNTTSPPSYSASYQGVDGITNVTGLLTNESITLPANVEGAVTTYTGATGTFEVFEGLTKKTGSGVSYSVVSQSQSNITVNIDAKTGVYTVTAMTSGLATLSGFATLRAIYNGVTIDKQISVTKAPTGATGVKGDAGSQGVPGANAPTIKSVVQQFYLSTSNSTQTGGSWLSTVPTWSSGKYYWVRVDTTYSNGTTSQSTPVLDNALNESLVTALEAKTANQDLSTTVTQHATLIEGKANSTTVDAIDGRVSTAEASLSVQSGQISLRVTKTELTTAIDGIEIGTRNLLRDSNIEFSFGEDDNKYIWDAYRDNTWEVLGD